MVVDHKRHLAAVWIWPRGGFTFSLRSRNSCLSEILLSATRELQWVPWVPGREAIYRVIWLTKKHSTVLKIQRLTKPSKETHPWSNGSEAFERNTRSVWFFSPGWCYQPGLVLKIQRLTSPQKKHTPDPTAHKRLKETHDPCDSLVPVGVTNRD